MTSCFSSCGESVRRHDPDRFLLSLLAPQKVREDVWALYAFNHEIAKTRESVTDTRLGLIRLQWWRDALTAIYAGEAVPEHPVIGALQAAIHKHNLDHERLDALIYAREFDLEDQLPANMQGTVYYSDYTSTPLLELTLQIVAPECQADVKDIAVAYALTGIFRATPLHLTQRRCYLPADMLPHIHHHYEGRDLDVLAPVIRAVAAEARTRLEKPIAPDQPRILRGYRKLALMYLKQIERVGFDVRAVAHLSRPAFAGVRILLCV